MKWVTSLLGVGVLGLMVAAVLLAVLGLVEYWKRPGVFVQGRAQALWALGLIGLMAVWAGRNFINGSGKTPAFGAAVGRDSSGQLVTFPELNCCFRAPGGPWISLEGAKLNRDSKLSYMRRFPDAYFMLIAEQIGVDNEFSNEQLAAVGKGNLQAAAQSVHILREAPFQLNGLSGLLVETAAQVKSQSIYYQQWYIVTNGYAYQLIGYGRQVDQSRIAGELHELFARFQLIDPAQVAASAGVPFTTNFLSGRFSYMMNVSNSAWHTLYSLERIFPEAEFGASRGQTRFVVAPVWLPEEPIEFEALTAGLLATMGITYPNENLTKQKRWTDGELAGVQYDFSRAVGGKPFHYRLRVLQGKASSYLLAAWTERPTAEEDSILDDALARFKFTPPAMELLSVPNELAPRQTKTRATGLLSVPSELTPRETKMQGFVLNQAGLYHFNSGDYAKALSLFCAAVRAQAQEPLFLINALQSWRHLDRPNEALAFLSTRPSSLQTVPDVRAWQAYFQAAATLNDQAITNYANLFGAGYRNDSHFAEYVSLLNIQQQHDRALVEVGKYLQKEDSVAVRLLEADIYRLKSDFTNAIRLLKIQREKAPFNVQIAGMLADSSIQAGLFNEALEISKEMLKSNRDSASAYFLKGRSEMGLKWFREAKASLEVAIKLAPANKDIISYLELVSGLVGEGNNMNLKEPIDPVALPAALRNALAEPAPEGYAKGHGAFYVQRIAALSWEPGQEHKITDYLWLRMLDASGVASFSTVQMPFDPLNEQMFVNDVRVLDPAGKVLATGKVADFYVLDDRSSPLVSQKKVLNIPVGGLLPGCQLAVTVTRRRLGRLEEFPFLEHSFSRSFPVRESILFLQGDAARLKYRTRPALEPEKLAEGLCWRLADPLVARWEPFQPPASSFVPTLWISDASGRWPTLASNYLASIQECLQPDRVLQDQARQLVAGLPNDDAKISALTRYVQTNFTYKAIEFGRRARIPNRPAEIVRNKYGDCKDHAVLLQQMLQASGVSAYLTLVSHHAPVQRDLPSLDQFDHMIVFVPSLSGGSFVDCTDKGSDAARTIPLGLAGRDALVLDPREPRFIPIPRYTERASRIEVQRRLRLLNEVDLAVDENLTLEGVHAAAMRHFLLQIPPSSHLGMLQRQMGLADVELSKSSIEPIESPGQNLQVHWEYVLRKQFRRSDDRLTGLLRAGIERSYLAADVVENRTTPFEITVPVVLQSTTSLEVPHGFLAVPPGDLLPKLDARFADCQAQCRLQGDHLILAFRVRQPVGEFKASEYRAFRDTMTQAWSLIEREIAFKVAANKNR